MSEDVSETISIPHHLQESIFRGSFVTRLHRLSLLCRPTVVAIISEVGTSSSVKLCVDGLRGTSGATDRREIRCCVGLQRIAKPFSYISITGS